MAIEVETKQWGNSIAVILPKEFVKERNIRIGEKLTIEAVKRLDLSKAFGILPRTVSGQQFKDEMRKEWNR
jgi:antitoxin component of MazEF toxin-antitoxin module